MRRLVTICLPLLSAARSLAAPAAAPPPQEVFEASTPTITRVTPMRVSVGDTLTIQGRNFKSQARQNTVIFRAPGRPHGLRQAAPREPHEARGRRPRRAWRAC